MKYIIIFLTFFLFTNIQTQSSTKRQNFNKEYLKFIGVKTYTCNILPSNNGVYYDTCYVCTCKIKRITKISRKQYKYIKKNK